MKQMAMAAMALALVASIVRPAWADEALPQDTVEVQSCIEGVREYNSSAEPGGEASRDECIGTVAKPCLETDEGQSTYGMMACYARELAVWDVMLNDNYGALKDGMPEAGVRALRDTQLKWIAYRDSKCEWPAVFFEGGTISGPISAACLNETTARRANELADYLDWTQN
ncbi:lysozyme inhibitor LprI family protein [Aquibium microcysteis]|uniref:lysozyme inhibitor LprI family protein n=1 Tax=Aquibium microcysteis TaxID=675281 RepID=UPI001AEDCA54|nr:lysozyme inhibitor LprI family protein [Aquibium microcysteis]